MTIFDYAIFKGTLMPIEEAKISIFNPALFASFGIYETVKVDQGRPFYLENHLQRLLESAQMLDLDLGVSPDTMAVWVRDLVQIDPQATWSLKIIAFGATEISARPVIAMQPIQLPSYPYAYYQYGATAVRYEGQRVLPACKSLNTLVNFLARRKANQEGALEGLLHHDGHFTEGSRTNLFAVRERQLLTPTTSEVLSGITRDVILQVMKGTDYPVIETDILVDLSLYEEFFISSTSMHVMPITKIDGKTIGTGQVGPVTQLAMARFETHYRQYMETVTQLG